MRHFLLSTVALAALAGQAFAADLPARKEAPVYVAPPPIFSWTGFYGGLDIGGSWGNANLFVPGVGIVGNSFSHNATNNGVIGGGFIGYNYQVNNFVIGLQGEFDGTGNGNQRFTSAVGQFGDVFQSSFNQNWIASIDGRLGYAWDRTLLYVIGGVAWDQQSANLTDLTTGFGVSVSNTRTGYDIGGGIEYAFTNNWTGRIEYRYYNFGTGSNAFNDFAFQPVNSFFRTTLTDNVVRVGLAYKFGAPEPVVAKY